MPIIHSKSGRRTNEDVFFAYYPRLLEWSLQITRRNREEAEDLVHDLYLRITRISRTIDDLELLEPYLLRILRNLYFSRLRRLGRDPINDLSIVDYDSAEQGLLVADRSELLFVRANLRKVCRYACQRKSTSRSASVLILRFFLGYYASEVMKILKAPRSAVDRSLQVARREARLALERPGTLHLFPQQRREVVFSGEEEGTQQLFAELREAIFSATEGECFAPSVLEGRYAPESQSGSFTALEISHLVSCRTCLDRVNRALHLPLLAERSPEDGIDRDSFSGTGGGAAHGPVIRTARKGPSFAKMERRSRELYEHRPESLQIAVDGEVRASQKVTAENSELHLKLAQKEEPSFIEVFSEQGLCLAYLHVTDPTASDDLDLIEEFSLSDGRLLIVTLSFAADVPIVHVLYRDPVVAEAGAFEEDHGMEDHLVHTESRAPLFVLAQEQAHAPYRWLRHAGRLLATLHERYQRIFIRDMNLLLTSAAVLAAGAIFCFCVWLKSVPPMSASVLLQRAAAAERVQVSASEPAVIYQRVRIQSAGRSIERSIHLDPAGGRRPKQLQSDAQTLALKARLVEAGVGWDEPLSAAGYQDWRNHSKITRDVVRKTGENLVTLTTTVADAKVIEESLTVRANDFHPVARTISFRNADNVEIAELDYAVVPLNVADPSWFEPTTGAVSDTSRGHTRSSERFVPTSLTEGQIDEAELGALLVLHQLHAESDNRVQIIRRANGVQVKGIVEDEARKRELETRLNAVQHVIPSIFTFAELERQQSAPEVKAAQSPRPQLQSDEEQSSPLAEYLSAKGESRSELSLLANRIADSAYVIDRESSQLTELMMRYGSDEQLSEAGRTKLNQLVAEHKATILEALEEEERSLINAGLAKPLADPQKAALSIEEVAEKNRRLCEELIFGEGIHARSAPDILPDLELTIRQLHVATSRLSPPPHIETLARKEQ